MAGADGGVSETGWVSAVLTLTGVEAARQTILAVGDGEQTTPRIAVAVDAVLDISHTLLPA